MSIRVSKDNHPIKQEVRMMISNRYKRITRAINKEFWSSDSETAHSRYVGSYGRGTAINTSDLDVLVELPDDEYEHFKSLSGNSQSRLLQAVKGAISDIYPNTIVKGDGQVVVVKFADEMKFEILPAFRNIDWFGEWDGTYKYPDTHMGGNWLTTNPLAEQKAMDDLDKYECSNGLLKDTCKHIRFVRSQEYSSYHLSGILIDSFVYKAIGNWHWTRDDDQRSENSGRSYEQALLDFFNENYSFESIFSPTISAPGSGMQVNGDDLEVLGKVLNKMV